MYFITADGQSLHVPGSQDRQIINPVLQEEIDQIDQLTFDMPPSHIMYGNMVQLKTAIHIYRDHSLIWSGRVVDNDDENDNTRTITCEGEMGYLLDSIQEPYDEDFSLTDFLQFLLDRHNAKTDKEKWFYLGDVTVKEDLDIDLARTSNDYKTTKEILDNVRSSYEGHFVVRHKGDARYLDYIKESTQRSTQPIIFGKNLLKVTRSSKGTDIKTCVIPLGVLIGNDRLTIEDANDGKPYLTDETAAEKYGMIWDAVVFDDIEDEMELLREGKAYLEKRAHPVPTISANAIDLNVLDRTVEEFKIGHQVPLISVPHKIDGYFQVNKITSYLFEPDKSELVLGDAIDSLTNKIASGGSIGKVGGKNNAQGALEVLDAAGNVTVIVGQGGIRSSGKDCLNKKGVYGNLQYMSNGSAPDFLGNGSLLYLRANAGSLYVYAFIPRNFVVEQAYLTLKSSGGTWNTTDGSGSFTGTVTGTSQEIKLFKGLNGAGLAMGGDIGDACVENVEDWEQIESGDFVQEGIAGSSNLTTVEFRTGNLSQHLIHGANTLRLTALKSSSTDVNRQLEMVGTGIAVLDIFGYTRPESETKNEQD